jgi:hypothetical protein
MPVPEGRAAIRLDPAYTQLFADGWILE